MKDLYREIFAKAEACRREGKKGDSIDEKEFVWQRNELSFCVNNITDEVEKFIKDSPNNKSIICAFAHALSKYSLRYGMSDKFQTLKENDDVIEVFIEHGKSLVEKSKNITLLDGDFTENTDQYDMLDRLREFCFVFCLASIDVFAPTFSVETVINRAIVFDALKDAKSLKEACDRIKSFHATYPIKNVDILWECGTLNYKVREYKTAIDFFKSYADTYIKKNAITQRAQDREGNLLDACYKIAYCYEFTNEISIALYMFARIFEVNDSDAYAAFSIEKIDQIKKWLPTDKATVEMLEWIDSVTELCMVPTDISEKNNTELLHGIAHLLNELTIFYAINPNAPKSLLENKPVHLLRIANRLMYAAACRKDVFFTCFGTNHSENEEFNEAINIFKFILDQNIFDEKNRVHLKMEVIFYLAHAYLYCGKYAEAEEYLTKFAQYCKLLNDKEGFAHLTIYNVYLLLCRAESHFTLDVSEIRTALLKLEKNVPSFYTTPKIQDEAHRLKNFLETIIALKELFDGKCPNQLALKGAIDGLDRCADDEFLLHSLKCEQYNTGGHNFVRVDNGKCSNDVMYIVGNNINLDENLFQKCEKQSTRTCSLGDSMGQSTPIIVLITDDEKEIEWAISVTNSKNVCWYVPQDISLKFRRKKSDGKENFVIIDDPKRENIINYAYAHFAYHAVNRRFYRPRIFLGLAPTKMTQLYKFKVRKTNGLHQIIVLRRPTPAVSFKNRLLTTSKTHREIQSTNKVPIHNIYVFSALNNQAHKVLRSSDILATFFIPDNNHWHYTLKRDLITPKMDINYLGDKSTCDDKGLHTLYTDTAISKDPYHPGEEQVQRFLNDEIHRDDECILCEREHPTNCAHKLFQVTTSTQIKQFITHLFESITLFNTSSNLINSLLVIKLDHFTYFLVLLKVPIDTNSANIASRKIVSEYSSVANDPTKSTPENKGDITPTLENVASSSSQSMARPIKIAISFADEYRKNFVEKLVNKLIAEYGSKAVFYDESAEYKSSIIRPELSQKLQTIYRDEADLRVVFQCQEYVDKQNKWCGIEWQAISPSLRSQNTDEYDRVMIFSFDGITTDDVDLQRDAVQKINVTETDITDKVYQWIKQRVTQRSK
jgi:tetratricopeptide (TPR) repeat protein